MKKKKKLLSSFERFMYKLCILIIVSLIIGIVCCETKLGQTNVEIQKLEREVEKQKKRDCIKHNGIKQSSFFWNECFTY